MPKDFFRIVIWILCLAIVAVGARNFEDGFSIDGPLYGVIAENIVLSGDWWRLDGSIDHFPVFAEHPHLGFWLHALWFHIAPVADWSARVPNHVLYVLTVLMFFFWIRSKSGELVATLTVTLLWLMPVYSNFHSNLYLDPLFAFLGFASLMLAERCLASSILRQSPGRSFHLLGSGAILGSGILMALAAATKGLAVFGFGLAFLYLWIRDRPKISNLLLWTLGFSVTLGTYAALLWQNHPEFLKIYWARQFTARTGVLWEWSQFLWGQLGMAPIQSWWAWALLAMSLLFRKKQSEWLFPAICFFSFFLALAPKRMLNMQYTIVLFPMLYWWLATWIVSVIPAAKRLKISHHIQKGSQYLALVALALVQYLPYPTHKATVPIEVPALQKAYAEGYRTLWLESEKDFLYPALLAWRSKLRIRSFEPGSEAALGKEFDRDSLVFFRGSAPSPGLCPYAEVKNSQGAVHKTYWHTRCL